MPLSAIFLFSLAVAGHDGIGGGAKIDSPAATPAIAQISKNTNTPPSQKTVKFSGRVAKGGSFEKQIGTNLFFRLIPEELGWTISVGSTTGAENNFCGVVTPPFRGINAIHIEGWHFRNSDNSGANEAGAKNVNAPQKVRDFQFVLNESDYRKAFDALQVLLWPYTFSKQQIDAAQTVHAKLAKGNGTLIIREMKLNTLEAGKQAGIDVMTIDVELNFPR